MTPRTAPRQASLSIANLCSLSLTARMTVLSTNQQSVCDGPGATLGRGFCSVTQPCLTFLTPWMVACQAPLSAGSSRLAYWSGLPAPPPGHLLDQVEPRSPPSPAFCSSGTGCLGSAPALLPRSCVTLAKRQMERVSLHCLLCEVGLIVAQASWDRRKA